MNAQEKPRTGQTGQPHKQTDEIGSDLETGSEVNAAIEEQGDDATAGIPRDCDAARHDPENGNRE